MKMKMKSIGLAAIVVGVLALSSCDSIAPKNYKEFPPGEDFEKVFKRLKEASEEGNYLYEISGVFRIEKARATYVPTHMEITFIPEKSDSILYEYQFDMIDARWSSPTQVTLHEERRTGKKMGRDQFSEALFKIDEMPAFSLFNGMYKKALEAAELGDEGVITGFDMNKFDGESNFYLTVSTKENKNKIEVYFDKEGNVLGVEK